MQNKHVSVVIPTYKTSYEVLSRTISSCLAQTYPPFEIIIVDDNGDNEYRENALKISSEYRTNVSVLFNEKNRGANYSRNRGVLSARGDFIAFLDSDDVWIPNYLQIVSNIIEDNNSKFITSNYQIVHNDGTLPPEFNDKKFVSGDFSKKELYQDFIGPTSTVVIAKETIIKAGLFDEKLPARQDYDMWIRVSKLVPVFYNYTPSVKVYRVGNDSISSSYKRNVEGTKLVLHKILSTENLTNDEKKEISASHYKHMALACILCNAYKESRIYAKKSLKLVFDKRIFIWYLLSFFPFLFNFLRKVRKHFLYKHV